MYVYSRILRQEHPVQHNLKMSEFVHLGCARKYINLLDLREDNNHQELAMQSVQKNYSHWPSLPPSLPPSLQLGNLETWKVENLETKKNHLQKKYINSFLTTKKNQYWCYYLHPSTDSVSPVCRILSPTRFSGPSWSSSYDVRMYVCL